MWSAISVAVLGGIYVCVGGIGVLMRPPGLAPLFQVDPYLAILEFLIILSAVALVAMMEDSHLFEFFLQVNSVGDHGQAGCSYQSCIAA